MAKLSYERPVIQKLNTGSMNKFGTRTEYAPVSHIEGVAVKEIIARFNDDACGGGGDWRARCCRNIHAGMGIA